MIEIPTSVIIALAFIAPFLIMGQIILNMRHQINVKESARRDTESLLEWRENDVENLKMERDKLRQRIEDLESAKVELIAEIKGLT